MAKKKQPVTLFGHEVSGDVAAVLNIISMHPRHMNEIGLELGFDTTKVANLLREIRTTYGRDCLGKRDGFYFQEVGRTHKET